jgi:hypothetical protein
LHEPRNPAGQPFDPTHAAVVTAYVARKSDEFVVRHKRAGAMRGDNEIKGFGLRIGSKSYVLFYRAGRGSANFGPCRW